MCNTKKEREGEERDKKNNQALPKPGTRDTVGPLVYSRRGRDGRNKKQKSSMVLESKLPTDVSEGLCRTEHLGLGEETKAGIDAAGEGAELAAVRETSTNICRSCCKGCVHTQYQDQQKIQ